MSDTKDFGLVLVTGTVLLCGLGFLAQCRSGSEGGSGTQARSTLTPAGVQKKQAETGRQPQSVRNMGAEEENEEAEKIKKIGRALQTIGANPELRRTYGFPK
ncbi:MAG: hypothetical protein ACE5I7_19160 [Candidatus Binatia bacterium]